MENEFSFMKELVAGFESEARNLVDSITQNLLAAEREAFLPRATRPITRRSTATCTPSRAVQPPAGLPRFRTFPIAWKTWWRPSRPGPASFPRKRWTCS